MHSPHARNAVQLCLWRYARQRAVCFTRQPCWTTSFARIIANRELGSIFELRVLIPVLVNFERECDLQYRPVIISDVDADPALDAVVRPSGIAFLAISASVRAAPSCTVSRVRNSTPS